MSARPSAPVVVTPEDTARVAQEEKNKIEYAQRQKAAQVAADADFKKASDFIKAEQVLQAIKAGSTISNSGEESQVVVPEKDIEEKPHVEALSDIDLQYYLNAALSQIATLTSAQQKGIEAVVDYLAAKTGATPQTAGKLNKVLVKSITSAIDSENSPQSDASKGNSKAEAPKAKLTPTPVKEAAKKILKKATPSDTEVKMLSDKVGTTIENARANLNAEVQAEDDEELTQFVDAINNEINFILTAALAFNCRRQLSKSTSGYAFFEQSHKDQQDEMKEVFISISEDFGISSEEADTFYKALNGNPAQLLIQTGLLQSDSSYGFGQGY